MFFSCSYVIAKVTFGAHFNPLLTLTWTILVITLQLLGVIPGGRSRRFEAWKSTRRSPGPGPTQRGLRAHPNHLPHAQARAHLCASAAERWRGPCLQVSVPEQFKPSSSVFLPQWEQGQDVFVGPAKEVKLLSKSRLWDAKYFVFRFVFTALGFWRSRLKSLPLRGDGIANVEAKPFKQNLNLALKAAQYLYVDLSAGFCEEASVAMRFHLHLDCQTTMIRSVYPQSHMVIFVSTRMRPHSLQDQKDVKNNLKW